mmetsp:Transcript_30059/g.28725  ORF Transcript_30059/g.28725 Transcript_30059/m.28725 type:complete len:161 (-) Transcript_30059:114-596(-)
MSASTVAATNPNDREVNPMHLSLEQLNNLKLQNEEELQELQRQLETLHGAKGRFLNARNTLDEISTSKKDEVLLVPLNSSLYVPGRIVDPETVLVELGTGYFAEKDNLSAKELIDRKIQLVIKSIESVENVGGFKKKNLEQVMEVMQYKINMSQEQRSER